MDFDLVAVGEVLLDVTVPAFAPGEVRHGPVRMRAGGTAVNAAVAAAASAPGPRWSAASAPTRPARRSARSCASLGIETLLATDPDRPTGAFVEAVGVGPRTAVADRGASDALAVDDLPAVTAHGTLVSGYVLFHERTQEAGRAALARVRLPRRRRHRRVGVARRRARPRRGAAGAPTGPASSSRTPPRPGR